jgi:hypothetical protein
LVAKFAFSNSNVHRYTPGRFEQLLAMGSVVLHAESGQDVHFFNALIPFFHYVPIMVGTYPKCHAQMLVKVPKMSPKYPKCLGLSILHARRAG